jgi:hypothetical protein
MGSWRSEIKTLEQNRPEAVELYDFIAILFIASINLAANRMAALASLQQ